MLFTRDKKFYKTLVLLAIPIVLQNLVTYCVGLCDNLMIGSLGDSEVSGVYMGNQIQTVLQVATAGFEATILILAAQYWGKRDTAHIRKTVSVGLKAALILGLTLCAVCAISPEQVMRIFTPEDAVVEKASEYLSIVAFSFPFFCLTQSLIASMRSVESARVGLLVSLCSLATDVVMNYILIFGKLGFQPMGVRGAALGTLIARIVESAVIVIYVFFIDKKLKLNLKDLWQTDKTILKDFVRYGLPLLGGQLVWGANLMANSMILGRFTQSVITAASLANTVNSMMYVCMNGMSSAVGIIVSKDVGAGRTQAVRNYTKTVQIIFLCLGLLTSLGIYLICELFISLYNITPDSAHYASQFIHVLCVTCIGSCYQAACLFGLVKSGGDVGFVFKNDTIFVFCVVIPSALITSLCGCPPWVVFFCLKIDQLLKCIVAFFKIRSFNWMKNLTVTEGEEA